MPRKTSYYSKNKILGYNKLFSFVTGARGIGKTYAFKTWAISDYIRNRKTCWWVMRYGTEIEAITKNSAFFADVLNTFPAYCFKVDGNVGYIAESESELWEPFIVFKALSESAIKAISDPQCTKMVFDEFIPLPGVRYLKNEVERFLELYFTISRGRDMRAIFLANNVTSVCPYYTYFKARPRLNQEFTVYDEIVIQNARTEAFKEDMRATRFGRLIAGSHYAGYAIENDSLADTDDFIGAMPQRHNLLFALRSQYGNMAVYLCEPRLLYITKKFDRSPSCTFVADFADHTEETIKLNFQYKYVYDMINKFYSNAMLYFDSVQTKMEFLQVFDRFLRR